MPSPTPPSASAAPQSSKKATGDNAGGAIPLGRCLTFFGLAIVGCAVDLWTKHLMFARYGMPPDFRSPDAPRHAVDWIWPNVVGWETALNHGALFGIGQGMVWLFATLSFVAIGAIIYWLFVAKAARDGFLTVALALILGGILGNLYDRLGLWGGVSPDGQTIYAVRDWILVVYGGYDVPWLGKRWPNFNIADSLLVCGAGLLIWHSFRTPHDEQEDETTEA